MTTTSPARDETFEQTAPAASSPLARLRALLPPEAQASLSSARELVRKTRETEREPFPTADPGLDRLLEGGLPRGRLVELWGSRSSGRFSTVLTVLAAGTDMGLPAALIDLGDGFDPSAAMRLGVEMERLLWLRPTHMKQTLAAAEMVLGAGFPLVVVELGLPPVAGGRGNEAAWLRLARAAAAQGAALLVSSPYRVSGTAAGAVLHAGRARPAWHGTGKAPRLLLGLSGYLALEKGRGAGAVPPEERLDLKAADLLGPSPFPAPEAPRRDERIPASRHPLRRASGF
jgi:hypothetical protein